MLEGELGVITLKTLAERGAISVEGAEVVAQDGDCFFVGQGVELNRMIAPAQDGDCFFVGQGVELNRMIAFQRFKRAVDQAYADAQLCVGSCYKRGAGAKLDQSKAFEWFNKRTDQGNIKAQHSVASSLLHGLGVPQDVAKAGAAFEIPARGHPMSQFNLGALLYKGREGVAQDLPKANDWLRKAADQKHAGAQFNLGAAYKTGTGVPEQDLPKAIDFLRKVADQKHPGAQFNLGAAYKTGTGVPEDLRQAARLFEVASVLVNHPELRRRRTSSPIAENSSTGTGVVKDLLAATKDNHRKTQFNLGNCFFVGKGVELLANDPHLRRRRPTPPPEGVEPQPPVRIASPTSSNSGKVVNERARSPQASVAVDESDSNKVNPTGASMPPNANTNNSPTYVDEHRHEAQASIPLEPDVLISYSTRVHPAMEGDERGKQLMLHLASVLAAHGISCFHGLMVPAGDVWWHHWFGRVDTCKVAIVVISPAYLASEQCIRELNALLEHKKELQIVPVVAGTGVAKAMQGDFLGTSTNQLKLQARAIRALFRTNSIPAPDESGGVFKVGCPETDAQLINIVKAKLPLFRRSHCITGYPTTKRIMRWRAVCGMHSDIMGTASRLFLLLVFLLLVHRYFTFH